MATPMTAMAHGSRGDDNNRNRDDHHSQVSQNNNDNRWWQPWHHDDKKPKPPVDPATCAQWQTRLNDWVAQYKATAGKDLQFGADYTAMVQGFVSTQGLSVDNYDALLADVTAKNTAATNAVDSMTAPDLNCEQDAAETTERGMERSTFKDVKRAMDEYRQSLKVLTEAVRASYGGQDMSHL